ncbi:MAG: hypothetical protein VX288_03760, partial [Planctomycetota bacterium]|nr:hypothetical protein [Planctomycetota bacterium]
MDSWLLATVQVKGRLLRGDAGFAGVFLDPSDGVNIPSTRVACLDVRSRSIARRSDQREESLSKSLSNLHLSLLGFLVLLIPLVLGLYYFQDLMQENTEFPEERLVYDLEEEEEPVEIAVVKPEVLEPRELAVQGRACLPGGDPLPGLKLTLGDQ